MKLGSLLLASCALLYGPSSRAQSPAGAPDLLSGTWTGDIGLNMTNRFPIKLELKFDGTSAISGTITGPQPAELKSGMFDPTTGALKLDLDVKHDGTSSRFVFEGTAVNGVATGRVSDGTQTGSFKLTKAAAAAPAQQGGGNDAGAAARFGFEEVNGWVGKAMELVPAAKYTYRPATTVRSFGQLVGHVADAYNYYCGKAAGKNPQWSDAVEKGPTDKATVTAKLKAALDGCTAAYAGTGQIGPLMANVGHTSLHYGNMITYIRMLGLVPPSS